MIISWLNWFPQTKTHHELLQMPAWLEHNSTILVKDNMTEKQDSKHVCTSHYVHFQKDMTKYKIIYLYLKGFEEFKIHTWLPEMKTQMQVQMLNGG